MELLIELVANYQRAKTVEERNRWAGEIVERIYPRLSRFIRSKVKKENVDDVLQEIFRVVFDRLSFFKGKTCESFLGWVYAIARCKGADSFRGRKTTLSTVGDPKILEEALAHVPMKESSAAAHVDWNDLQDALSIIKVADYPCLGWLWDRYVTGLSFVEIGEDHGITKEAARKRVHRCFKLAEELINK